MKRLPKTFRGAEVARGLGMNSDELDAFTETKAMDQFDATRDMWLVIEDKALEDPDDSVEVKGFATKADAVRYVPDGWTLEPLPRLPDHALLTSPLPGRYMATVDFRARGIRAGYSTTGRFVGEEWNKRRKKYGGRGWRQVLVDDAVAHLKLLEGGPH